MTVRDEKFGRIAVSQAAIASLVAEAVKECYGVVGMSRRNRLEELTGSLQRGSRKGVEIGEGVDGIVVDIYVVVEYGMPISEVASGVMRRVYFTLTETAGIPVRAVNVHVQGLRVSDSDNSQPD